MYVHYDSVEPELLLGKASSKPFTVFPCPDSGSFSAIKGSEGVKQSQLKQLLHKERDRALKWNLSDMSNNRKGGSFYPGSSITSIQ